MAFNLQTNQMVNIYRDIVPDIQELTVYKNLPLFSTLNLMDNGRAAKATKHEWPDLILPAVTATVNVAFDNNDDPIVLDRYYGGIEVKVAVGSQIKIKDPANPLTDAEIALVKADATVSTNTISIPVTRGAFGTSALPASGTIPVGTKVRIDSTIRAEGFDAATFKTFATVNRYNYTQIFAEATRVSGTAQHMDDAGKDGILSEQERRTMEYVMKMLHRAVIGNNVRYQGNDSNGDELRLFGGLDFWVKQTSGNIVDAGGADLDETVIEDIVTKIKDKGGSCNVILVSHKGKQALDKMKESRVLQQPSDEGFNNLVSYYDSNAGTLQIVASEDVDDNTMYIFHTDNLKVAPVQGRSFQMKPLAVTGDNDKALIYGEYTVLGRCFETMYKVTNLSV